LQQISKTTFGDTYAGENTQENMHAYLEAHFSLGQLKKRNEQPRVVFLLRATQNTSCWLPKSQYGVKHSLKHKKQHWKLNEYMSSKIFKDNILAKPFVKKPLPLHRKNSCNLFGSVSGKITQGPLPFIPL